MAQGLQGGAPEWLVEADEVQELLEGVEAPELLRSGIHDPRAPTGWALEKLPSGRRKPTSHGETQPKAQLKSRARNAMAPPTCGRLKGFVAAQGLSPNGDGSDY